MAFSNDDVRHLLLAIQKMAREPYPFPDDTAVDSRYAMALGLIMGICVEAVNSVRQDRMAHFVIETGKESKSCPTLL